MPKQCGWNHCSQTSHAIMSSVSGCLQMQNSSRGAAGSASVIKPWPSGGIGAVPSTKTSPLALTVDDSAIKSFFSPLATVPALSTYWFSTISAAFAFCPARLLVFLSYLTFELAEAGPPFIEDGRPFLPSEVCCRFNWLGAPFVEEVCWAVCSCYAFYVAP